MGLSATTLQFVVIIAVYIQGYEHYLLLLFT